MNNRMMLRSILK